MLGDHYEFPGSIKGEALDHYLATGWYRTGCIIFTTHYLTPYNDTVKHRVYWLRYVINNIQLDKKAKHILFQNRDFKVNCRPFQLTEELDELHKKYVKQLRFESCDDLGTLLMDVNNDFFDSYVIEVRDGGKLVGAGIFDLGKETIEGIINIYDPTYKKNSLGKLLMIMKYQVCFENKIALYYPGYYMPAHPLFDYKLFLDRTATEVYIPETGIWQAFPEFITAFHKSKQGS